MTRPEQKALEQRIVATFIKAAHLDAKAMAGERPDCHLVLGDGQQVGLEITELTDPALKASSAAMKRLENEAEALLTGCRVFVVVYWRTEARLKPKSGQEAAEQLAGFVREFMHHNAKLFGRRRMLKRRPALAQVNDVHVYPDDDGPKVSATTETWAGQRAPYVVQASLDEKEQKVAAYRAATGLPQWLFIATGSERAQHVLPQLLPADHVYRSSFDRAYLLDVPVGAALQLRLTPPAPA